VTRIVTSAADLNRDWLSQALGNDVRSVTLEPIGAGQSASTYRLFLEADDCPATLIAKFAKGSEEARRRLATAHRNEVGFYRELAAGLDIRVPACRHAAISPDAMSFTLLLEDLSPCQPGRQADGCSFGHAAESVRNLAHLHAARWNDEALNDIDFLPPLTEQRALFLADLAHTATDQFIARYSDELSADDVATLREVAAALFEWQLAHPEPFSLVHGDYRLDNLMLHPTQDDVVAVDWQTVTVALPARDLGYFIGTSLPTGQRRAEEERLLAAYHDELQSCGVRDYSSERCLADYRVGQLHGPMVTVIGSLTSTGPRSHDGDEMFLSMARRSCTAVRDHQSINAL
jgi:aminoglycoside/choline kinase family phosphotransferase